MAIADRDVPFARRQITTLAFRAGGHFRRAGHNAALGSRGPLGNYPDRRYRKRKYRISSHRLFLLFHMRHERSRGSAHPLAEQPFDPVSQFRSTNLTRHASNHAAVAIEEGGRRHGFAHAEPRQIVAGYAKPYGKADVIFTNEFRDVPFGFRIVERCTDKGNPARTVLFFG